MDEKTEWRLFKLDRGGIIAGRIESISSTHGHTVELSINYSICGKLLHIRESGRAVDKRKPRLCKQMRGTRVFNVHAKNEHRYYLWCTSF